ncbi:inactive hydroxysteroid dehydrogenase-like protein 1 [Octopus bimaculoides]|uniref:inactive hydroxysteroid dehydrogenase-like protein 1 n=1 Tax=Octopus bimaculoides TaxID=37653 RepID=UPI00071DCECF|nr:inactive hydroxysteroid dehydrogenase-like protein 1 [Octopus bimaculoides]|eukprot:XP_014788299.1 PREDICTED: inactive hydroxysteroid dehydrogenase-like protein 1 [Octopus bimaculoides]
MARVVTGSSEGIGKAYAHELASRGMNLILVSKGDTLLKKTAESIAHQFGVEVIPIVVDFSANREIYHKIWSQIKDKEIGILINNVGVMYHYPQLFLEVPEERLWQLINVNISATTMRLKLNSFCCCYFFFLWCCLTNIVPIQISHFRKRGAIVMMSSASCINITPQLTVYAGTKKYVDYFVQALQYEYRDSGVIFQSLVPLYVATRMTHFSATLSNPNLLIPSASVYARHAITTLGFSNRTTGYWPHSLMLWLLTMLPSTLWMWCATHLNNGLRRQRRRGNSGSITDTP